MPIKMEGISYRYGKDAKHAPMAVQGIDLTLADGELVGLMGLAGSGRTTLLQLISGVLSPSSGHIYLDGEELRKGREKKLLRERLAYLPARPENTLFETSVEKELAFSLRGSGLSSEEKQQMLRGILEEMGFDYEAVRQRPPLILCRAERIFLAIGAVLITQPDYLLLDEPFSHLTVGEGERLMRIFKKYCQQGGCVVLACNDSELLSQYADHVLLMEQGRIIRDEQAKRLLTDYYDLLRHDMPIPPIREACQRFREQGIVMPANLVAYDQFLDRLKIIAWRKKNGEREGE